MKIGDLRNCSFQGPEDGQTTVCLRSRKATEKGKRDEVRKAGRGHRRSALALGPAMEFAS